MKKSLEEQGYKIVAVQDECFVGTENSKEAIVVLVRYEKHRKQNILIKYDVKEFPNADYLSKFMEEIGIEKAIPSNEFKAPAINRALHLIKAL